MSKTVAGRFFEDFQLGEQIQHATPRTVTEADATLYLALTGSRFGVHCSATLARMAGLPRPPLEDLLTFHLVFGRTVPDVSRNAIANLGYADGRFGALLYPGDSVQATSEVIGLKESSKYETGVVWVRTRGVKDDGRQLLAYVRWVLVRKPTRRARRRRRSCQICPSTSRRSTSRCRPASGPATSTGRCPARCIASTATRPASGSITSTA